MKPEGLLDEQSAALLGLPWLAAAVAPASPYGARLFAGLRPYRSGQEAEAAARALRIARLAAELAPARVAALRGAIAALPDLAGTLARLSMDGALDDPGLFELLAFCEGVETIDGVPNAATRAVGAALRLGRREGGGFYLADAFDAALGAARSLYAGAQAEFEAARGRARAQAAAALGRDEIADDELIVMRASLRGPVPAGVRIVREAATYLLCAMEYGESVFAALERREAALEAVAAAEQAVRRRLAALVGERVAALRDAVEALARLDVTLGAVRFAQRWACSAPEIVAEPALELREARFAPLEEALGAAGRAFVPLRLSLRGPAVLTGPNMGGKSVAMQTCGFVALTAAFGLPVPAEHARLALFDRIEWLGVGRDERPRGLLSSFAAELTALRAILSSGARRSLVLADEFARTTSPNDGAALCCALLQRLRERGDCALLATHLAGVAAAAEAPHFAARDFVLTAIAGDEPPAGEAIALAESLGLDAGFIAAAYRALAP